MTLERRESHGGVAVWLAAVALSGLGLAAAWLRLGLPTPACRLREWTGLPCATCGSTRMLEALLAGNVAEAVAHNPLVFAALIGLLLASGVALVRHALGLSAVRVVLERRERLALGIAAVTLLLADWAWVIWRHV